MISVTRLSKKYGSFIAVDDLSFEVPPGEVLGFLGPNGAGKTTTMRMITGYLPPSSGRIRIGGFDLYTDPVKAKRLIGYLPENPPIYPEMTVRRYLRYVDDFALFSDQKSELQGWLKEIEVFLQGLRLTLHGETAHPRPVETGFPFLGFIVFPDHRRLKSSRGHAFRRRFYHLVDLYHQGQVPYERVRSAVAGWVGHVSHGDTYGLRARIFGDVTI